MEGYEYIFEYQQIAEKISLQTPSRLFIYEKVTVFSFPIEFLKDD